MDVSANWLREFVTIPKSKSGDDIMHDLTQHCFAVEGVRDASVGFDKIVVGVVESCKKHPDADKLRVCKVDDGKNRLTIVCGGSNVVEGMKVALAKSGAKVRWHGEGDLVTLKDTKIRGVMSQGMICAAEEIGLATGHEEEKEIMDLSFVDAPAGTPLVKALMLDDIVLDVENKGITNRPDAWGHYGIARELGALYGKPLKKYAPKTINPGNKMKLSVKVQDNELCRRYIGLAVEGVKVAPSPMWLQARLRSAGVRSISNIVDITNFVMLELGQPMHAFDLNLLSSPEIIIRRAKKGEAFTPLGGEQVKLRDTMCVIADKSRVIALAGVKGGENSGISEDTTTIVLESANFEPLSVRRAAHALDLRTDASSRFEKGLDPALAELAMRRSVELVLQLCPGAKVISNIADDGKWQKIAEEKPITVNHDFLEKKLGTILKSEEVVGILERLGFGVKQSKNSYTVTIPSWRATGDVGVAEDLVEEVGRIYGYDKIAEDLPVMSITPPARNSEYDAKYIARDVLSRSHGFSETQSYSFISMDTMHALDLDPADHVAIANPLSSEQSHVRRTLLPNMFWQMSKNMHGEDSVALFEVGKVFEKENDGELATPKSKKLLPYQPVHVSGCYSAKDNSTPFFNAKKAAVGMLEALGIDYSTEPSEHVTNWMHPGRTLTVYVGKQRVGDISELHPAYSKRFDLDSRIGFFSFDLTLLSTLMQDRIAYKPLPKFPAVKRDLAFVVNEHTRFDYIMKAMCIDPLLTHVELFDLFRDKKIGKHKKSLAFHLEFSHPEKTLTAEDVEKVYSKLVSKLEKDFKAEVRK